MKYKRFISLLTSFSILCSMTLPNVNTAFAESAKTVTIINEDENGKLQFVGNYEDVYKEIDSGYFEASLDDLITEETTEVSNETISEETSTESITEESSETNTTVKVTDESTIENIETSEEVESTSEFIEDSIEIVEETSELAEENVVLDTTVTDTKKITIVDPDCKKVMPGETVILEAIPNEGYSVSAIFITTEKGKSVNYSFKDNKISFVMPNSNVNIKAMFSDSLSEIIIDDSVIDNSIYIKSNLNSDYVSFSKFEPVNMMVVKQTVIDDTILKQNGLESTIDNIWASKDTIMSILNFQMSYAIIFDVDENSKYYVAFVNTMQNDNSTVTDFAVAKNNDNAEMLEDSIYDYNTGILYINKDYITKIEDDSTDEYISKNLNSSQVQLLNVIENNNHSISLIINDDNNILNLQSGIIETDMYDTTVSIKLNNGNNNINVKVNDISYGNFNLAEDYADSFLNYDKDSNILTIAGNAISINTIEINVLDEENTNDSAFDIHATTIGNLTTVNGPTINVISGKIEAGNYIWYRNPSQVYQDNETKNGDYKPYVHSLASFSGDNDWGAAVYTTWKNIRNYTNIAQELANTDVGIKSSYISFEVNLDQFKSGVNLTGNGATVATLKMPNITGVLRLACAHISEKAKLKDNQDEKDVFIRILKVDTTNKKVIWAAIAPNIVTDRQAGLGIFVSSYTEAYGTFNFSKNMIGGVDNNQIGTNYKATSGTITITHKSTNTKVITITVKGKSGSKAILTSTINNSSYAKYISGNDTSNLKFNLTPGTYVIKETNRPSNWSKAPDKEITITNGGTTTDSLTDYPVFYSINGQKLNDLSQTKNVKGAEFYLYYSPSDFYVIEPEFNTTGSELSSFKFINGVVPKSVNVSEKANSIGTINTAKSIYRVATFTANENGILVPSTSGCYDNTKLYKPNTSTFGKDFNCPQVNGNRLDYCPAGYYILLEVKAPEGYILTDTINMSQSGSSYSLNANVSYEYQKLKTSNPDQNTRTNAESISLTASNTTVKRYTLTRVNANSWKINGNTLPTSYSSTFGMFAAAGLSIGNNLSNSTNTFSKTNNTTRLLGAKRVYKTTKETTQDYIDSDGDGFDTQEQKQTLLQRFTANYSLINARYTLYYYYNGEYKKIATGKTTNVVTGYENDGYPYRIKWELDSNAKTYASNIYLNDTTEYIYGLPVGSQLKVVETNASSGTIIGESQNQEFTLDKLDNTIPISATYNDVKSVSITVNKQVILKAGDIVSPGSKIIKRSISTSGVNTDTEITVNSNYIIPDETYILNDTEKHYEYILTFIKACETDRQKYFAGLTFDLWYNTAATSSNDYNFPTYFDAINTYKIENYTLGGKNYTNRHNTSNTGLYRQTAQHVGTFKYEVVNGKTRLVAYTYSFPVYNSSLNILGSYTGTIFNNTNARITDRDDTYISALPIGSYAVYEYGSNEYTTINTTPIYRWVSNNSKITNQYMYVMNTTTNLTKFNMNKIKESKSSSITDYSGTKYEVYWSPYDINTNPEKFNTSDFTYINNEDGTKSYQPSNLDDVFLVGRYHIQADNTEINSANFVGIVELNLFNQISYYIVENDDLNTFYVAGTGSHYIPPIQLNTYAGNYESYRQRVSHGMNRLKYLYEHNSLNDVDWNNIFNYGEDQTGITSVPHPNNTVYINNMMQLNKTFYGPAKGTYIIVETDPVLGAGYSEIQVYSASDLQDIELTFEEPEAKDPLNLTIEKSSKYWDHVDSIEGTQFVLKYYQDQFTNDSATYSQSLASFASKTPDAILYFEPKDNIVDGKITGFDFNLNRDYLVSSENENLIYYNTDQKYYYFNAGTIIISEIPNDNYSQTNSDTFKVTINDQTYDLGKTIFVQFSVNGVDSLVKQAQCSNNTWVTIPSTNDTTATITAKLNNTRKAYPFTMIKKNNKDEAVVAKFRLDMYESETSETVIDSWTFTVNGSFDSEDSDVFENVDGKPLVDGKYYKLTELESYKIVDDIREDYYLREFEFVYDHTNPPEIFIGDTINYFKPYITTHAYVYETDSQTAKSKAQVTKVTDKVYIKNLAVGNIYTIEGIAIDITDPDNPVIATDSNGDYIIASTMFYADSIDKEVNVEFEFATTDFSKKTINFQEYLAFVKAVDSKYSYEDYIDGTVSYIPEQDINDETTLYSNIFTENNNYSIVDTHNLLTVSDGNLNLSGKGFIYNLGKTDYIKHADNTDKNQNIYFPSISTTESDFITHTHYSGNRFITDDDGYAYNFIRIMDDVVVTNIADGEYKFEYEIIDSSNNQVINSGVFYTTANNNRISTNVLITLSKAVDEFYVTEKLYDLNDTLLAEHLDKVASQTGYVSSIGTTAQNPVDSKKLILEGSNATVKDTVSYKNFCPGNYIFLGYLVDKNTNLIVAESYKTLQILNPQNSNGSTDVIFNFSTTSLPFAKTLVVYEYAFRRINNDDRIFSIDYGKLIHGTSRNYTDARFGIKTREVFDERMIAYSTLANYALVAKHYDNGDANQTVYIPTISTTVTSPKVVQPNDRITVNDQVTYRNLIKNDTYKIVGYLVDTKNTETEEDDTVITRSTKQFIAPATEGTISSVDFTFNANNYINSTIVVYEYVYNGTFNDNQLPTYTEGTLFSSIDIPTNVNGITLVGKHADSTDDKQTFIVTSTPIKITKQSYEGNILSGASLKLTNLTTNKVLGEWSSTTTGKDFNLTPGDYVLEEIKAPNGKALTLPIYFTVKEVNNNYIAVYTGTETELEYTLVTDNNITIKQYNLAIKDPNLMALPTAGGIGTTPYIIIGLLLMSIAIVFKKKKYYI